MEVLTSEEIFLILDLLVSMGYSLMYLTLIIVCLIHNHFYILSTGKVSNEYP